MAHSVKPKTKSSKLIFPISPLEKGDEGGFDTSHTFLPVGKGTETK
jgi:hypothetical protein